MTYQSHSYGLTQEEWKPMSTRKPVPKCFEEIHNHLRLETTQMSRNKWMAERCDTAQRWKCINSWCVRQRGWVPKAPRWAKDATSKILHYSVYTAASKGKTVALENRSVGLGDMSTEGQLAECSGADGTVLYQMFTNGYTNLCMH